MFLLWTGDLDNDGNLDVLISDTNELGQNLQTLYLSRDAPQGKLVQAAAAFFANGG